MFAQSTVDGPQVFPLRPTDPDTITVYKSELPTTRNGWWRFMAETLGLPGSQIARLCGVPARTVQLALAIDRVPTFRADPPHDKPAPLTPAEIHQARRDLLANPDLDPQELRAALDFLEQSEAEL